MKQTLALLVFAEVADLGTTWFASLHGTHEGNPVFLAAAGSGFVAAFVFAKLGVVPVIGTVIQYAPTPRVRHWVEAATRIAATMLLGVAASNVLVTL